MLKNVDGFSFFVLATLIIMFIFGVVGGSFIPDFSWCGGLISGVSFAFMIGGKWIFYKEEHDINEVAADDEEIDEDKKPY